MENNFFSKVDIPTFKKVLRHIIKTNNVNQETKGLIPVSVNIIGESGIGKTAVAYQIAEEFNMKPVKISLAQTDELSALTGFPIRQFRMCEKKTFLDEILETDSSNCKWVDEHVISEYLNNGFYFTGENRMSYCPPDFIVNSSDQPIMLILDDFNRAELRYLQAIMDICEYQKYATWSLPKGSIVLLTSNPDNSEYLVNQQDVAHKSRMLNFEIEFNLNAWVEWAEYQNIDTRCISFMMLFPEIVKPKDGVNPRSLVKFFNTISTIEDFSTPDSLELISYIADSCVGKYVSSMFFSFINNKLDKLITPEQMLFNDKEWVANKLKNLVLNENNNYRADIASVLTTRLITYTQIYFDKNKNIKTEDSKKIIERIKYLSNLENVFTQDLVFVLVNRLLQYDKRRFQSLLLDTNLVNNILI